MKMGMEEFIQRGAIALLSHSSDVDSDSIIKFLEDVFIGAYQAGERWERKELSDILNIKKEKK